jgi:asparagine synthase (glutamine-hydrolysing)
MCGIAGIVDFNSNRPEEGLLRRMIGMISHRGPDAFGIYLDNEAGLAHARLSIIDISGGDQPIHNEDKSIWIVYNGEIFNYPELRQDLITRGHEFYTRTDTETLVHLYEERGPDFFKDVNGQFAFAIWDKKAKNFLLGRDRLGIRPIFYHQDGRRLLFGSEIKALFADPQIERALDPQTISDVFTCWAPLGSSTAFLGVHQLPPAHYAIFSSNGMTVRPYWQLGFSPSPIRPRSDEDISHELQDLLCDATRIRMRADVPVGAYLDGGIASTCLTSIVKRHFNSQLKTFSVSSTNEGFDEVSFQGKAVQALETDHGSICCTEEDIGDDFPQVLWHVEVPLLCTAPAPLYELAQFVRQNDFKVVLTGEGSDEIFAGCDIFKEDRVRRFWARRPDSKMRPGLFQKLYPDTFTTEDRRKRAFFESFFRKGLADVDAPGYSHMIRWENTSQLKSFFSSDLQRSIQNNNGFLDRFTAALPADFTSWDPLSRAQHTEITIILSNYLLSSEGDRVTMAHAVKGRFPFLDYRVVEFACSLPAHHRLRVLKDKFILRKAAADFLPPEPANSPKQPYRAPISRCFFGRKQQDYAHALLSKRAIRQAGYFDPPKVKRLIDKCCKQEGSLLSERENMAIVGILSTQLLHDMFIRRFPAPEDPKLKNLKAFK